MAQEVGRRDGASTRRAAQRVAMRLFTEQGYDSTSLREIADELGIRKASLYYHFPNKQAILLSLVEERGSEAADLLAWAEAQPRTAGLIQDVVSRWVESFSAEKLAGIRFLRANPHIARTLDSDGDVRIGDPLTRLAALLGECLPDAAPADLLVIRMALLSINAAVEASAGTDVPDEVVLGAARAAARSLISEYPDQARAAESRPAARLGSEAPGRLA